MFWSKHNLGLKKVLVQNFSSVTFFLLLPMPKHSKKLFVGGYIYMVCFKARQHF